MDTRINRFNLPSPRMELVWEKLDHDWTNKKCTYYLVIPLRGTDIRREDASGNPIYDELYLEMGKTISEGGGDHQPIYNGEVDTPFRDGAHAQWDSEALGGIPVYAICEKTFTLIEG